ALKVGSACSAALTAPTDNSNVKRTVMWPMPGFNDDAPLCVVFLLYPPNCRQPVRVYDPFNNTAILCQINDISKVAGQSWGNRSQSANSSMISVRTWSKPGRRGGFRCRGIKDQAPSK